MPDDQQTDNPRAVTGGNRPIIEEYFKEINDDLPKRLKDTCGEVIDRAKELITNAADVPDVIENEDQEAQASDIVSQMNKHRQVADSRRLGIGALPRQSQAIINNFFNEGAINPLIEAVARIEPGVTKFKRVKAENERRAREEAERKAREEQARLIREKEEAERKKREAEAAAELARQEEQRAKEAALRAKEEARLAEVRRIDAEVRREEAEKAHAEAETKRAKQAAERKIKEEKEAAEKAERDRAAAKEQERLEREKAAAAKTDVSLAKGDVSDANKNVRTTTSLAKQATGDVARAERATNAPLSKVSSVRGEMGSQSSLRTRWVGSITDRQKLDLGALRDFMSDDDLQKALNKFVAVHKGGRKIKGADIYEETDTTFR